jgi:spermidine synthase
VLGSINFLLASILLFRFRSSIVHKKIIYPAFAILLSSLIILSITIKPIILYGEQKKYKDTIIFTKQTIYQKIVITKWKNNYWLFINGNEQFSTLDEQLYHEPLVHPALSLLKERGNVLILGGGDGLALREILKFKDVKNVTLVDIDPQMTLLGSTNPILTKANNNSFNDLRVKVVNIDANIYLSDTDQIFDLIISDLPDPNTIELSMLYSKEFFMLAKKHLTPYGVFVTQSTSPIYSNKSFLCIIKTMEAAGFGAAGYSNQVPTMGQWGFTIGMRDNIISSKGLKARLQTLQFSPSIPTRFINQEAMISMSNFGKGAFDMMDKLEVNSRLNPVLYRYYKDGSWDVY